jgi:ATP-dependent Clp protease protease subunit
MSRLVFNAAQVAIAGGYSMKAKGKSEAEIILYGDVGDSWFGGVTAKQFADDLKALGKVDTINLRINSAGGDVFDGLTIYRRLVDHPARVVAHIDGLAASIASVIAMAGNEIKISESGFLMIHDAWGIAIGSSTDMRTMADLLETTTGSIRDVYAARTGNAAGKVQDWMTQETWFTAAEAVESGFADSVVDNLRIAASIDPKKHRFNKAPTVLSATPNLAEARERIARMKAQMDRRRAG